MHKYYYTYKITLLLGSLARHYYYGQHSTYHLNDSYCGSGKKLCDYYKKYGHIEGVTYKKEIIAFYNNEEELNKAEAELVGDKYKTDPLCLNLCAGGCQPGCSTETRQKMSVAAKNRPNNWLGRKHSEETKRKISEHFKGKTTWMKGKHHSEETRKKLSELNTGENNPNYGKKRSEETCIKISKANKGKRNALGCHRSPEFKQKLKEANLGENNPQYGKKAIHLYIPAEQKTIYKMVDKEYIYYWLDDGWILGGAPKHKEEKKQ